MSGIGPIIRLKLNAFTPPDSPRNLGETPVDKQIKSILHKTKNQTITGKKKVTFNALKMVRITKLNATAPTDEFHIFSDVPCKWMLESMGYDVDRHYLRKGVEGKRDKPSIDRML